MVSFQFIIFIFRSLNIKITDLIVFSYDLFQVDELSDLKHNVDNAVTHYGAMSHLSPGDMVELQEFFNRINLNVANSFRLSGMEPSVIQPSQSIVMRNPGDEGPRYGNMQRAGRGGGGKKPGGGRRKRHANQQLHSPHQSTSPEQQFREFGMDQFFDGLDQEEDCSVHRSKGDATVSGNNYKLYSCNLILFY